MAAADEIRQAQAALTVLRGWDFEQIAAMYAEPTDRLLSEEGEIGFCP